MTRPDVPGREVTHRKADGENALLRNILGKIRSLEEGVSGLRKKLQDVDIQHDRRQGDREWRHFELDQKQVLSDIRVNESQRIELAQRMKDIQVGSDALMQRRNLLQLWESPDTPPDAKDALKIAANAYLLEGVKKIAHQASADEFPDAVRFLAQNIGGAYQEMADALDGKKEAIRSLEAQLKKMSSKKIQSDFRDLVERVLESPAVMSSRLAGSQ